MFHFFKKAGTAKELEHIIAEINMNMQNNYKDAAQEALRNLEEKIDEFTAQKILDDRQKEFYCSMLEDYKTKLKSFCHKEQRPYW
ncbi:hypothetical protein IMSAGC011_02498 [Lachnospiraceae bacterium]|nr:hypothetical protein IMSAGC011_02498 [Lachnospiraceae bacterium]